MSNSNPTGAEMTGCQFSVYPLSQDDIDTPIRAAIAAAAATGVTVRVQNLSTLLQGDEDAVFGALRAAFSAARAHGRTVMVAALTTGVPGDDTVAEIQTVDVAGQSGGVVS